MGWEYEISFLIKNKHMKLGSYILIRIIKFESKLARDFEVDALLGNLAVFSNFTFYISCFVDI